MKNLLEVLMGDYKDLYGWLSEISRFTALEKSLEYRGQRSEDGPTINLAFYTHEYRYSLTARCPNPKSPKGYLGLMVQTRKPRAGEDWSRGNDLADGSYSIETWRRCLADIVSYELVRIQLNENVLINENALTPGHPENLYGGLDAKYAHLKPK